MHAGLLQLLHRGDWGFLMGVGIGVWRREEEGGGGRFIGELYWGLFGITGHHWSSSTGRWRVDVFDGMMVDNTTVRSKS